MGSARRWGAALGLAGAVLIGSCAPETTPLLQEDLGRLRADLARIEQTIQKGQAEVKADLQRTDRQVGQSLTEVQRSLALLGTRLDELGREAGQIQGRIDELRRRVDALALQLDAAGPPPAATAQGPRPVPPAGPQPEPTRPGTPATPPTPGPTSPGPPGTAPPPGTPPGSALPGRQGQDLYQTAYIDYTRGNYNLAIAAFREFIRLYPNSDLAEKAQYWIGESHFSLARGYQGRGEGERATQEFERAVQEFRRVLINYPRGDRVPTALYKEALSLLELKQPALAGARFQFLIDQFPSTEEAAKAKEEMARIRRR